jgi:hypothetical protein
VALSSTEASQRVAAPTLQVEIPTVVVMPALQVEFPTAVVTSSPNSSLGEEGRQVDLDTDVGEDASCLDLKAARILPEAVAATWEVQRLWEILPTTLRVSSYSEKHVIEKRLTHACLIIKILAWIQNSNFIDLRAIDVWGR